MRNSYKGFTAFLVVFTMVLFDGSGVVAATREWNVEDFPSPSSAKEEGSTSLSFVVDPDQILNESSLQDLNEQIQSLAVTISVVSDDAEKTEDLDVQLAIAIVEKMKMNSYQDEGQEDIAAEAFCRSLHDKWGVGHTTSKGDGTGVVIFLSVADRVIYISKGSALNNVLTDSRIESVLSSVRPILKQAQYGRGLRHAIGGIRQYCLQGEPDWKESILTLLKGPYLYILAWFGILLNGIVGSYRQKQQDRAYAQAQSQLSELDRARAQVLQGQYQATSCPICLETFCSSTVGSDGQPIKLLRCGHVFDETCWSEWVTSGHGTVTKCPICQKDIGQSSSETQTEGTPPADATAIQQQVEQNSADDDIIHDEHQEYQQRQRQERAVQRYQQERNFRLMRLAIRYPNLISNRQVSRWTWPTYNDDLACDPSFVNNNPARPTASSSSRTGGLRGGDSYSTVSFGGGRSAGGRGGRF